MARSLGTRKRDLVAFLEPKLSKYIEKDWHLLANYHTSIESGDMESLNASHIVLRRSRIVQVARKLFTL